VTDSHKVRSTTAREHATIPCCEWPAWPEAECTTPAGVPTVPQCVCCWLTVCSLLVYPLEHLVYDSANSSAASGSVRLLRLLPCLPPRRVLSPLSFSNPFTAPNRVLCCQQLHRPPPVKGWTSPARCRVKGLAMNNSTVSVNTTQRKCVSAAAGAVRWLLLSLSCLPPLLSLKATLASPPRCLDIQRQMTPHPA
jgi:hypothetical protein